MYVVKVIENKPTVVNSKTSVTSTSKLKRRRSVGDEETSVIKKEVKLGMFLFCNFFESQTRLNFFIIIFVLQKLLLVYFQFLHQKLIFNGVNLILL